MSEPMPLTVREVADRLRSEYGIIRTRRRIAQVIASDPHSFAAKKVSANLWMMPAEGLPRLAEFFQREP